MKALLDKKMDFLLGGGETGGLMRSMDWSETPLGPASEWPESLRTSLSICINSIYPMSICWGPDLILLYNDAFRPILGARHPHPLGRRVAECWPEARPILAPLLTGVIESGESASREQPLLIERHGTSEKCLFQFSCSPIRDGSGRIAGVFTILTENTSSTFGGALERPAAASNTKGYDEEVAAKVRLEKVISDLQERERELLSNRVLLQDLIDSSPSIVAIRDLEGRLILLNQRLAELYQVPKEKALGTTIHDFYPKELADQIRERDLKVIAEGKPLQFESLVPRSGIEHVYVMTKFPLRDGQGEIYGVASVLTEITEHKRALEALRRGEARLRAIFESVEEAIITLDDHQCCQEANPAAGTITGVEHDRLVGRFLSEFVDPGFPLAEAWSAFLENGHTRVEIPIRKSDGSIRTVEATGVANIVPGGHLFVGHDITDRKRYEQELRTARDQLEISVRERTAELEKTNQEHQEFAFVAAHDLREPLRKIQMFGDLVVSKCKDSLDEQSRDYLERMQGAARRMQMLLTALLDYSRVTTRAEEFGTVDLNEAAREALSDVEYWVRHENGRVELGDLPTLEADRSQVVRLFQNLLSNGLKYHMPEETPFVRVYRQEAENGRCLICFEDDGIGFDEKYLEKIFRPFERLHGRSSPYSGVGMGLTICRKIVERHGGTITARSAPGRGATFIVSLPMRQEEA